MEFNANEAKKFLLAREKEKKEKDEAERNEMLQKAILILQEEFRNSGVEVFLVGSILRPYSFTQRSDIDIVLKNYPADRFDIWAKLEEKIGRTIEIIRFEKCAFQEFVIQEGYRVV